MAVVLFVHGTGGRKTAYDQTFAIIGKALRANNIDLRLERCLWGDTLGSGTPLNSVPGIENAAAVAEQKFEEQQRWADLAVDPFIELRLIAAGPADSPPPGGAKAARDKADAFAQRVLDYQLGGEPLATLKGWGLDDLWPRVWSALREGFPLVQSTFRARSDFGEPGRAAARAIVALLLLAALDDGRALPTPAQRNPFVLLLANDMGVLSLGVRDSIKEFFVKALLNAGTRGGKAHRGPFSERHGIFAGDILLYQARGAGIRAYIAKRIADAKDDVYLLAHSLGGVACFDLLAMPKAPARVRGLITVGSQAPLFAEFGALVSLEPGVMNLPPRFPKWLNILDENDFLSYLSKPVFGEKAIDHPVNSGQPFPLSHGAYWSNPETWQAIADFVK
jgi:hypothetical protein